MMPRSGIGEQVRARTGRREDHRLPSARVCVILLGKVQNAPARLAEAERAAVDELVHHLRSHRHEAARTRAELALAVVLDGGHRLGTVLLDRAPATLAEIVGDDTF